MRKTRFTTEQIVAILHEAEAGALIRDLCRRHGVTETTFYRWRRKYGGLQVSEAQRLKALEDENRQLKHAFVVATEKTADLTGIRLSEAQQQKLSMAYHWGLGVGAGALYAGLRMRVGWLDWGQGSAFGLSFFLLVDEALNTALGMACGSKVPQWRERSVRCVTDVRVTSA